MKRNWTTAMLADLSLKQLRRNQAVIIAQIPLAFEQRNDAALEELQAMEILYAQAIDERVFGTK